MGLGTIAADNASNPGIFPADRTFLVWGDDAGSIGLSTALPGTAIGTRRITRVWRVQETGTVGSVVVRIPVPQLPGAQPVLMRSPDATFDASDTVVPLAQNGTAYEAMTDFATGEFFTFAAVVGDPGGVGGAGLWVKANTGLIADGLNQVEQWLDESGSGNTTTELHAATPAHTNAIAASAGIVRVANGINFNPAVDFTGANGRSLKGNAATEWDLGPLSIFAVSVSEGAVVGNIAAVWDSLANWTTDPNSAGAGILVNATGTSYALDSNGSVVAPTTSTIMQPRVVRGLYSTATNTLGGSTWLDGVQEGTGTAAPTSLTTLFEVGGRTAGAAVFDARIFNGKITEVVVYKSGLTAADANRVESYLALKYGITLRQTPAAKHYLDSAATVIWDATVNAAYNNNIGGIGRDDASTLSQKQSRSVNTAGSGDLVTIGLGTIAADNAANANTFGADRDFLTWGDNGLATTFSTLLAAPAGQNASRMLRAWRTQETGTIGTVMVGVPSTLGVGTPLHLVVSNDATFDATDTWVPTAPFSPDGLTTYLAATANFTSGQFFTFATVPPLDFGDAPASSATLLVNDGARHAVPGYDGGSHTAPLMLGALIDVEADGQPGPAASADDTADVDDEDGVVFPALVAGQAASVAVTVTNSGPAARLSAWADWNGNGSFADAGEQIVTNLAVVSGPNAVPVVPPASVNGAIIFRFRLSTQTGLGSTGIASDGEVEDYQVLVGSVTDLAITKTDSQSSYVPGAPISYTIVVTNAGPSLASGVVVNDIVPAAITGVTASCSATGTASCGTNGSSGNNVSFTAASLGAGAGNQLTITIAGIVDPSTSGNLANTATVAAASDPNAANNSATDTDTRGAGLADLRITKTDGLVAYVPGTPITYTVSVTNAGPSHATALNINDLLPATITNVTVSCAATGAATCGSNATAGNTVSFTGARVNAGTGDALTLAISGTIRADATGNLTNTAQVSVPAGSGYSDPNPGNDSATDTDALGTLQVDLSVTATDGRPTYVRGAPITYTVIVMNAGPSDATGVSMSGLVPAVITGVTANCVATGTASCGVNTTAGNSVAFTGASVAAGAGHHLTITLSGVVSPTARGALAHTATVSAGAGATDTTPGNNSATDTDSSGDKRCDVNGDGTDEIVTGAGPGGGPHVHVWSVANGTVTDLASFYAYHPAFGGGAFVACGDVDGDGRADVVTGAGPAGGPHVRAFSLAGGAPVEIASFYAFDPAFGGGVRVAVSDVDGDGMADIIAGAGPGGGPHVRAFSLAGGAPSEIASFYAYDPGFAGGVFVAAGDVTGDGRASIITGTYREGGPLRVFDVGPSGVTERTSFFPYFAPFLGPVHVGAADINGDGTAEILTGAGPFGGPHVRAFSLAGGALTELASFYAYDPPFCDFGVLFPATEVCDGVYVGGADIDGDGRAELVTGTNRRGGPLKVFQIGSTVIEVMSFFPYFEAFVGPVYVAVATPGQLPREPGAPEPAGAARSRRRQTLRQLFHVDVPELHERRNAAVATVGRPPAVVLQPDGAFGRQIGQRDLGNHGLAIQQERDIAALHRQLEGVPLADVVVGVHPRGHRRLEGRRRLRIGPVAVHLARSHRPAPDVELRAARAARQQSGIGIRRDQIDLLPVGVALVPSIGHDDLHVLADEGRLLDAPVDLQLKVLEGLLGPEVLVLGLAARVVVDHAVHDLPVAAIALRNFPAGQILAVEKGDETLGRGALRHGAGSRHRQDERERGERYACSCLHRISPTGSSRPGYGSARAVREVLEVYTPQAARSYACCCWGRKRSFRAAPSWLPASAGRLREAIHRLATATAFRLKPEATKRRRWLE